MSARATICAIAVACGLALPLPWALAPRAHAPALFGAPVLSKRCVFILDVSGSMIIKDTAAEKGQRGVAVRPRDPGYCHVPYERMRMFRLQEAMAGLIRELTPDTKFTILTFATNVRQWQTDLVEATPADKEDAIAFCEAMQPEGFTATDEALRLAFGVRGVDAVYLVSDGIPQRGRWPDGTPYYIDKQAILEEVAELNRTRTVRIFTIGMGEADPRFMRILAEANGGSFTAVR